MVLCEFRLDDQVKIHVQDYFDASLRHSSDTPDHVIEVAVLFVQCIEVRKRIIPQHMYQSSFCRHVKLVIAISGFAVSVGFYRFTCVEYTSI